MAMFGFTAQQIDILDQFMNRKHIITSPSASPSAPPPASLSAPQAGASTPPELPPELPPQPVCPLSSPPPLSIEFLEEVEHTRKHGASKAVPRIRVAKSSENCIRWPPKSGGIYMSFSRDEEPEPPRVVNPEWV